MFYFLSILFFQQQKKEPLHSLQESKIKESFELQFVSGTHFQPDANKVLSIDKSQPRMYIPPKCMSDEQKNILDSVLNGESVFFTGYF